MIFGSLGLGALLGAAPDSPLARGLGIAALVVAFTLLFVLGRLLKKFEFVRLLRYSNAQRTVTIRFSSAELARRALEVLVIPEEADLDDIRRAKHAPPRTRPIFRYWLASPPSCWSSPPLESGSVLPSRTPGRSRRDFLGLGVAMAMIAVRRS